MSFNSKQLGRLIFSMHMFLGTLLAGDDEVPLETATIGTLTASIESAEDLEMDTEILPSISSVESFELADKTTESIGILTMPNVWTLTDVVTETSVELVTIDEVAASVLTETEFTTNFATVSSTVEILTVNPDDNVSSQTDSESEETCVIKEVFPKADFYEENGYFVEDEQYLCEAGEIVAKYIQCRKDKCEEKNYPVLLVTEDTSAALWIKKLFNIQKREPVITEGKNDAKRM